MLSLCFFLLLDIWFEFQQQLDYVYVTKGNEVLVFDQVNLIKWFAYIHIIKYLKKSLIFEKRNKFLLFGQS